MSLPWKNFTATSSEPLHWVQTSLNTLKTLVCKCLFTGKIFLLALNYLSSDLAQGRDVKCVLEDRKWRCPRELVYVETEVIQLY